MNIVFGGYVDFSSSLILLVIAIPSILLLYLVDVSVPVYGHTIKIIGGQWFWVYENASLIGLERYDSYTKSLNRRFERLGVLRLLDVDNQLVLRVGLCYRLLITSSDVLHSWAVRL